MIGERFASWQVKSFVCLFEISSTDDVQSTYEK